MFAFAVNGKIFLPHLLKLHFKPILYFLKQQN